MELQSESGLLAHGLIQDPGAVPLVLAVVGHRDPLPELLPALEKNLRQQLEQLIYALPHTPLLMLNGLAEGIDTMAAHVFLDVVASDRKRRGAITPHHQLVAALPKTPNDYRQDFQSASALEHLEELLNRSDGILHPGNCSDLAVPPAANGLQRPADDPICYGQQGIFLVRHCFMLFAFYDGVETNLVGGTSQTVAMQKGELHPLFVGVDEVLANREPGVLITHQTPRHRSGSPRSNAGNVRFWNGGGEIQGEGVALPSKLLTIPKRLEQINACIGKPGFKPTCYDNTEGFYTKIWSYADQVAREYKNLYENWCRILVVTGLSLVLLAQLSPVVPGLFWALLLLAFWLFPKLQKGPKLSFIEQRCLAECLTVQYLWIALGIDDDAADLFHTRSNKELGWIRNVLRGSRVQLLSFHSHEPLNEQAMIKASGWINGQVDYLGKRIHEFRVLAESWKRFAIALAILAVAVATAESLPNAPEGLKSLVVVLLASLAAALAYSNLIGYAATADRFSRSLRQFQRGKDALAVIELAPGARASDQQVRRLIVVEAVGREKLDELNDWVASQLQRVYAPGA